MKRKDNPRFPSLFFFAFISDYRSGVQSCDALKKENRYLSFPSTKEGQFEVQGRYSVDLGRTTVAVQ